MGIYANTRYGKTVLLLVGSIVVALNGALLIDMFKG